MCSPSRFKLATVFTPLLILIASIAGFVLFGSTRLATHAAGTSLKFSTRSGVASATLLSHCGAWSVVPSPDVGTSNNILNAVAAAASNDVWAVGYYTSSNGGDPYQTLTAHWNGISWSISPSQNPSNWGGNFLNGVDVISVSDAWAVGDYNNTSADAFQTLIEQWNGTNWTTVPSPNVGTGNNILNAVAHVPNSNQLWAVGREINSASVWQTLIERWNGKNWSVIPSPNDGTNYSTLSSVAVVSATDVWAVGYSYNNTTSTSIFHTLIAQWNGTVWSIVSSSNPGVLNVLNGVARVPGSNQLWTVGQDNTGSNDLRTLTMRSKGNTWSVISSPNIGPGGPNTASLLNGVTAVSANSVWTVGYSQSKINSPPAHTLIEHWNGTTWSIVASPNPAIQDYLNGVTRVPHSSQLWAIGYGYSGSVTQTLIEFYC